MFVLIWATLLFSVRGGNTGTGASSVEKLCQDGSCFNLEGQIPAEAGLCVVIPCSFNLKTDFEIQNMTWFKCNSSKTGKCDLDMISRTNENETVQTEFKGRVSLLEPDLGQNNCSIIINDLTVSHSGSYQLRVKGSAGNKQKGFTSRKVNVSVKDLTQKPTVMIPALTEGQQTTLTCTAPGLCSGSDPTITWTWRGSRKKSSHITGNVTEFKTEKVTSVTQRHSSTLTFNASAEHHGTNVTCKVSFINNITTEETVTLNVTFSLKILESSSCEVESEVLTCRCISEGFPPPTIKFPMLDIHCGYAEYCVFTNVSNQTVRMTVSLKHHNYTTIECVSSNGQEARKNLTVNIKEFKPKEDKPKDQPGPGAVLSWVVAAVSLIVNIIFIICLAFLWNTRKKVKPNQEDRTYMSLRKNDLSPEYDVIGQPLK